TGALGLLRQLRAAGSKSNNSKCFRHEETPPGRTVRAGSCYLLRYVLRLWQFLHRSCRLQSFSWEPCLTIRVITEKGSSISRWALPSLLTWSNPRYSLNQRATPVLPSIATRLALCCLR